MMRVQATGVGEDEDFGVGDYDWKDYIAPAYYATVDLIVVAMVPHIILAFSIRQWNKEKNKSK